jgi:hypothetical protein
MPSRDHPGKEKDYKLFIDRRGCKRILFIHVRIQSLESRLDAVNVTKDE